MPNIDTTDEHEIDARLTRVENLLLLSLEAQDVEAWVATFGVARLLSRMMRTRIAEQGEPARDRCQALVGHLADDVRPPTPRHRAH